MQHSGWTSQDIRALFDEIVEELSLLTECQHCEHMVDITDDTEPVIPMTDRISDRYTIAHIKYYSESTNDEFAEDLLPKTQGGEHETNDRRDYDILDRHGL